MRWIAETMRELGYRTVDMLVERLLDDSVPPLRRATPAEMRARISGPPPAEPQPFDELLRRLGEDVLPFTSRGEHPGLLRVRPVRGTWPGALGDFIASACNVYAGSWMEAAGPTQLELQVLDWFRGWIGLPETAGGTLLSGGSAANMTALACRARVRRRRDERPARRVRLDQAHSSLARGGRILGFRPDQIRVLPVGADSRLSPRRSAAPSRPTRAPAAPLLRLGERRRDEHRRDRPACRSSPRCAASDGLWLHVDAAYGGFAVLTERGRRALDGIGRADSVTLDPHKWLYQPYECGCLLVRDAALLRRAFEMTPAYLHDAIPESEEVNLADLGIQLTRTSRAIKVWLSLCAFGVDAFAATIDGCLDLAEAARKRIDESPSLELAVPPSLSVLCFRRRFDCDEDEEDRRNAALVAELERSGIGLISSTRVAGATCCACASSATRRPWDDVERVIEFLERAEVDAAPAAAVYERHPDVGRSWLAGAASGIADLERLPILRSLTPTSSPGWARRPSFARSRADRRSSSSGRPRRTSTSCSRGRST